MSKKTVLSRNAPPLFSSPYQRGVKNSRGDGVSYDIDKMKITTNINSTSSFRYDSPGSGLKSTQELQVDWTKFENHTFFNSAVSKVNIAFSKIINDYPFDGTRRELESFEDSLTGYEMYVLSKFSKNKGYLFFSGSTNDDDNGTFIEVKDSAGGMYPAFSKDKTGKSVLNPGENSFSCEMQLYIPDQINENCTVFQKRQSIDNGIFMSVSGSESSNYDLIFSITSGSAKLAVSSSIEKGKFNHISAIYNRKIDKNKLFLYVNTLLVATSSTQYEMGKLNFTDSNFIIGSGSKYNIEADFLSGPESSFHPKKTLSGAIDEFRYFKKPITLDDIKTHQKTQIFQSPDLQLYFRFNEPSGSYPLSNIVLDRSGNSLHSKISNFKHSLRSTSSIANPMTQESSYYSPVLYPSYKPIENLNRLFLEDAKDYDDVNPNLISRLVPVHYFLEGQASEGLMSITGSMSKMPTLNSIPGSGKVNSGQLLLSFLLIWAKYFDELKMFLDAFSKNRYIDYNDNESITKKLLPSLAEYYGITLPNFYSYASPDQFVYGTSLTNTYGQAQNPLSYVQNEIWKRLLINYRDEIKAKGTLHSIKSFIRSTGLDPDSIFTIREYGGPTKRTLNNKRTTRKKKINFINFSGSLPERKGLPISDIGFSTESPYFTSKYLSSSRIELGIPEIQGAFLNKGNPFKRISNNKSDGLFTSGSFTIEGIYRLSPSKSGSIKINQHVTQSLMRVHVTGSSAPSSTHGLLLNLIGISGSNELRLFARPGHGTDSKPLNLRLTGSHIFDGNTWSIACGRLRGGTPSNLSISSSYFLYCARQEAGKLINSYFTSSFYFEDESFNAFESINASYNQSGSFLTVGSQSLDTSACFLNDKSNVPDLARETKFGGKIGQIRFWSKAFSIDEWKEHARNYTSLGVENPQINYNFVPHRSGSFEKLRLNVSLNQKTTSSNASGDITLFDFSQGDNHIFAKSFEKSKKLIRPKIEMFSMFSSRFDLNESDEKVRVRSFDDRENVENSTYSTYAPVYHVLKSEEPMDDTRFTVDFSTMKSLDEDIMAMFSNMDFFDDALGKPNLMFSTEYPDLTALREVYFNNLTHKFDFQKFVDFFRWFNSAFEENIMGLIPRKVNFLGVNFVIESHVLERHKMRYYFDDIYLDSLSKDPGKGTILLSNFIGTLKKF